MNKGGRPEDHVLNKLGGNPQIATFVKRCNKIIQQQAKYGHGSIWTLKQIVREINRSDFGKVFIIAQVHLLHETRMDSWCIGLFPHQFLVGFVAGFLGEKITQLVSRDAQSGIEPASKKIPVLHDFLLYKLQLPAATEERFQVLPNLANMFFTIALPASVMFVLPKCFEETPSWVTWTAAILCGLQGFFNSLRLARKLRRIKPKSRVPTSLYHSYALLGHQAMNPQGGVIDMTVAGIGIGATLLSIPF